MRAFIILAMLAAARAEGGGYNYGANIGGSLNSGSFAGGSLSGGSLSAGSLSGGPLSEALLSGVGSGGSSGQYVSNSQPDYANVNTEFNKEFFTYTAPEVDFEDNRSIGDLAASLKKNLRVLFIRAPENKGLENAALSLAKQAAEQQTAIYVLTKQGDLSSLANRLQDLNHQNAKKPEVHFVKYRTAEDALNAQRTIQQEYDRLGGSSISHNGGIAPVLDFATKQAVQQQQQLQQTLPLLDERRAGGISVESSAVGNVSGELEAPAGYIPPAATAPSSNYLPANKV